jgi:carbon monoxide dehydrogenase subunit G
MHLDGSHRFDAGQQVVWDLLTDPAVLTRATPGVKELQLLDGEGSRYRAIFDIKMGPINSGFDGTLEVADQVAPASYRLLVEVDSKIGAVSAEGLFNIQADGDGTVVAFQGDAKMSGVLARMGQRVISGVARMFTKQFFAALEEEL